jgi:hypothetical protein
MRKKTAGKALEIKSSPFKRQIMPVLLNIIYSEINILILSPPYEGNDRWPDIRFLHAIFRKYRKLDRANHWGILATYTVVFQRM